MLTIYKTIDGRIQRVQTAEKGTWLSLIEPTEDEINWVSDELGVQEDFLRAALDEEETSRVELDDDTGQALITVDIPVEENKPDKKELLYYSTFPVGIIETKDHIITVSLKNNSILEDFSKGRVKFVFTNLKSRFIFQFLYLVATRFLVYLRRINRMSDRVEKNLSNRVENFMQRSVKNKELLQMLDLEKSLVYFSTSLKANQLVVEKLKRGRIVEIYEDDMEIIDDVLIEMDQAIEMSNIYTNILRGMMDAFSNMISNNMNIVMKILTALTILMSIPTMIASVYGMNISGLPFPRFVPVMILIIAVTILTALILKHYKMFS